MTNGKAYHFDFIRLSCSDQSMCTFDGIRINGIYFIKFDWEQVLLKESNNQVTLDYSFFVPEKIAKVELVLADMFHNIYVAETRFLLNKNGGIEIMTIYDINPANIKYIR